MRCGLFGKLSAKRDFIALATPRSFLEKWEPWVQSCMSASQHQLGPGWQGAYLTAPLWRFWLGADVAGATVLGVFMPSVDGVGRYYPLTLMAVADPNFSIAPPDLNSQGDWFAQAEDFLLTTLERSKTFDETSAALDALPQPEAQATENGGNEVIRLADATVGLPTAGKSVQDALTTLRANNHSTSAAATFWWTEGGGEFPPLALSARGLLDPFCYTMMLTGKLPAEADNSVQA
ncbi:type VI secretion system-associated protein TagF [Bradyrhizobium sp. WSM1417]|uniref:type VI secretion system-associated protein TagF n=1 Tax=Bradyrhizobium sp. WSM1417 TaxID=754500 RepID=UPI0004BB8AEB|nr:type VI secretion system-associated protein TagF [Bradyrhizobium sp. WSM1417]